MVFPESPRVIYRDNPLEEVVCQVRFPAILKITETPIDFQERIRDRFPLLEQRPAIDLPPDIPSEMAKIMASRIGNVAHFLSRDKVWDAALYRDFLALSCKTYVKWEEFREWFQVPFHALCDIYSPAFYTRIGLRYRNVIHKTKLSLGDAAWSDLLDPHVCGELASPDIAGAVEYASRELLIKLSDKQKVRLMHGTSEDRDSYGIDADFFNDSETEVANVEPELNAFNRESGRLFRWAISQKLHDAMGPATV